MQEILVVTETEKNQEVNWGYKQKKKEMGLEFRLVRKTM